MKIKIKNIITVIGLIVVAIFYIKGFIIWITHLNYQSTTSWDNIFFTPFTVDDNENFNLNIALSNVGYFVLFTFINAIIFGCILHKFWLWIKDKEIIIGKK